MSVLPSRADQRGHVHAAVVVSQAGRSDDPPAARDLDSAPHRTARNEPSPLPRRRWTPRSVVEDSKAATSGTPSWVKSRRDQRLQLDGRLDPGGPKPPWPSPSRTAQAADLRVRLVIAAAQQVPPAVAVHVRDDERVPRRRRGR